MLGHLPKEQHEQARSTLRAAWKLDADEGIRKLEQASSAESVGEFWFGQVAKCVIQSDFQCPGGAEPIRPFGDHSGLPVEAFDNATGELPPGSEPVQDQVAARAHHAGNILLHSPSSVDTYPLGEEEESTMPKSRPPYPAAFRQQMVELVRSGRTPGELAREFEPSAEAIRNWVAQADRDAGKRSDGLRTEEHEEIRRLRRENRQLREEREILAKATAWFARETGPGRSTGS